MITACGKQTETAAVAYSHPRCWLAAGGGCCVKIVSPHLKIDVYGGYSPDTAALFRFATGRRKLSMPRRRETKPTNMAEITQSTHSTELGSRPSIDDLSARNWHEPLVLRQLHIERGWPPTDIARKFEVDVGDVRDALRARGLYQDDQSAPPKQGLARKLWERGTSPDGGDAA